MLAGAHGCGHWRPLEPLDPPRVFSSGPPLRGISVAARHHAASAGRPAEKIRALRRAAARPLSGKPGAVRIYPDAARPGSVSGGDVDRALGRYAHGGRARAPAAAPAQELRKTVRPGDGLLRMRRAASRQGSAYTPGARRPEGRPGVGMSRPWADLNDRPAQT